MREGSGALISLQGISFSWTANGRELFSDLDMVFSRGTTACLIGPNGSGKTTLMELLLGWRKPDSGRVVLDGRPLPELSSRERGK
ncbi:MAG: ABC transporter ATP-binding protein, partial [Spirochaetaceae bacterium]|nr:ABC transporter ATP-binding protein [Spirochaetaceae bacterium]